MVRGSEPKLLDAQVDPYDSAAMATAWVSDMLVAKDLSMKFVPFLATEWTNSPDGKTWTFKLRKDVKFHDDTPFNAEAVKFNFERILDPKTQSAQSAAMLGPIDSMKVVDEFTFSITHKAPYPPFLDSLSEGFIAMWSPTAVKKFGPDEFQRHMVGSGPFKLVEYKPAEQYVFERNPNYNWPPAFYKNQGPAYLEKVTLRWINEVGTAMNVFRAGEADVMIGFPPQNIPDYRINKDFTIVKASRVGSPVLFVMNTSKAPFDDLKVREALQHAMSGEQVVKVVLANEGGVATRGVMYPGSPCYWPGAETLRPYDLTKAKALLEEAGWKAGADGLRAKGGQKLQVTLVNSFSTELGPIVQAQLREAGVDAKIDQVPGPIQLERAGTGDFNLIIQHMAYSDPGVLDMLYNSKNERPGGWSWTRFKDAKLDAFLDEAQMTVDATKRCELFTEAQKIIAQNAIVLPLYGGYSIAVIPNNVKDIGFGPRPTMEFWLQDAYFEE